jgi:hypothetical protein
MYALETFFPPQDALLSRFPDEPDPFLTRQAT